MSPIFPLALSVTLSRKRDIDFGNQGVKNNKVNWHVLVFNITKDKSVLTNRIAEIRHGKKCSMI